MQVNLKQFKFKNFSLDTQICHVDSPQYYANNKNIEITIIVTIAIPLISFFLCVWLLLLIFFIEF